MAYPPIAAPAPRTDRTFWSVMIPTYRPDLGYLTRAVASITEQLRPGPDVQIEIVDDLSPEFDPAAFLARAGFDGVTWHRNERRLGLGGNWNACVERARGRWIHLLHQDDFVLPGFYDAMRGGIDSDPEIGAAFCDTYFANGDASARCYALVPMREAGRLHDWQRHVFVQLAIQTPSIVVRRDAYEALGGFDEAFDYILDWDMWKRIAVRYPMWYEPQALACYRLHRTSQTAQLRRSGRNVVEIAESIERSAALLPADTREDVASRAYRSYTEFALENVLESLVHDRSPAAALAQLAETRRLSSPFGIARAAGRVAVRALVRSVHDVVVGGSGLPADVAVAPPAEADQAAR